MSEITKANKCWPSSELGGNRSPGCLHTHSVPVGPWLPGLPPGILLFLPAGFEALMLILAAWLPQEPSCPAPEQMTPY